MSIPSNRRQSRPFPSPIFPNSLHHLSLTCVIGSKTLIKTRPLLIKISNWTSEPSSSAHYHILYDRLYLNEAIDYCVKPD